MQPKWRVEYYQGEYPPNLWPLQPCSINDSNVIALGEFKNSQYAVYLNPTDKRGYRCIVRLINNENMPSTFNREFSSDEREGLNLLVQLISEIYRSIVPIVQIAEAGNNAHHFDVDTRVKYIGTNSEPCILHTHIIGRGDPNVDYIPNVNLLGPFPGETFDLRAKTKNVYGNEKKVPWERGEEEKVVNHIRMFLRYSKGPYEKKGLNVS